MKLDYRVKREGRGWLAFLKRPGNARPLFVVGATKHEALAALLTTVANMAATSPARVFGRDWTEAANARFLAEQAGGPS